MKAIRLAGLALCAGLLAQTAVAAEQCGSLSDYQVEKVSFKQLPVTQALKEVIKGTPLQLSISGSGDLRVSAENVEGPLDSVLEGLSKESRFVYALNRCSLVVTFAAPVMTWQVSVNDGLVSQTLLRWGVQAGWRVVWDTPKDFQVAADDSFSGSFEDAVYRLVQSLSTTDAPVQATFHPNHVVRITRFDGQSADLRR